MPPTPLRTQKLAGEQPTLATPLLPTVVVSSFKGGVWKTSISVALAERLAWAGLRVLMVTTDQQEDARFRLGVRAQDGLMPRVHRGPGSIVVIAAMGAKATDLLYRIGPDRLNAGVFDVAVLDTPPVQAGGNLPGVFLIATVDGTDASRNLVAMLRSTPKNTEVALVRVQRTNTDEWREDVATIAEVAGRPDLIFLPEPLPKANPIAAAHNTGKSVWDLPRRGCTKEYLEGIESLAAKAWDRIHPDMDIPSMPPTRNTSVYVPGWDDDDA